MRYSFVTPRTSDPVQRAREAVTAVEPGNVPALDTAYERLEAAEKVAKARRASAHAMRVVYRTLPGFPAPDPNYK